MSTNAIPEGKYKCAMFMFQHPFNSFVINFCGLHEPFYFGTGKNGSRTYVVEGEVCAIDKDLFFKKNEEWGVAIEKVRVMDESIFYDKSGGICTRRNGYGMENIFVCSGINNVRVFNVSNCCIKRYGHVIYFDSIWHRFSDSLQSNNQ